MTFRLDDVKNVVDKMEKAVRFRINAGRDNEVIKRLYDTNREKLLFALPPKVKSVSFFYQQSPVLCTSGVPLKFVLFILFHTQ
jgi:hypothetical protein